jgi:uncharacterized repeat protein (TIGR04076 family)
MDYLNVFSGVAVEVLSVSGQCKWRHELGQRFTGNAMTPGGICPYIYHNMVPYRLTLEQGGYFKWRTDRKSVEVLCPNPDGKVNVKLAHDGGGKMSCRVLSVEGHCCAGYRKGTDLPLESSPDLCPLAFVSLFPDLLSFLGEASVPEAEVSCPSTFGQVRFRIRKQRP